MVSIVLNSETDEVGGERCRSEKCLNHLQLLHQLSHHQLTESIVEHYRGRLLTYLRSKIDSAADIDDLFQDICHKINKSYRLGTVDNIESYIFTIAANTVRDKYSSVTNRISKLSVPIDTLNIIDNTSDPDDILECSHNVKSLWRRIDGLPPRCKHVFLMNRVEGKRYKAIAEELGISISMVEKYVSRGLSALRDIENINRC